MNSQTWWRPRVLGAAVLMVVRVLAAVPATTHELDYTPHTRVTLQDMVMP
jgi:hypothetical protein